MSKQYFHLVVGLPKDMLNTVMGVLGSDRRITILAKYVASSQWQEPPLTLFSQPTQQPPTQQPNRYANGVRFKGISAVGLAQQILTERSPRSIAECAEIFKANRFSPRSAQPSLCKLVADGFAVRNEDGTYSKKVQTP